MGMLDLLLLLMQLIVFSAIVYVMLQPDRVRRGLRKVTRRQWKRTQ
jgi:hypothetical protein